MGRGEVGGASKLFSPMKRGQGGTENGFQFLYSPLPPYLMTSPLSYLTLKTVFSYLLQR